MPLFKRSYEDVLSGAKAYFADMGSTIVTIAGTPEHAMAHLTAQEISGLYNSVDYLASGMSIDTATAYDLDRLAAAHGIHRGQAQFASDSTKANVKFYIDPKYNKSAADLAAMIGQGSLVIPKGTELSDGNNIVYYTTEAATFGDDKDPQGNAILDGVFVNVIAYNTGPQNNVDEGQLTHHNLASSQLLSSVAEYINVTNLLPISSGEALESDADLRVRIASAFSAQAKSNVSAILDAVRAIPGVSNASITNGIYGTGTFGVFVDTSTPIISPAIINKVQAVVDSVKAAGVRGYVLYPEYRSVFLNFEVSYVDTSAKSATDTAIRNDVLYYINNLPRGSVLYINKLLMLVNNHSNVRTAEIKTFKVGDYDPLTQQTSTTATMPHVDQSSDPEEKWFTSSGLITFCQV